MYVRSLAWVKRERERGRRRRGRRRGRKSHRRNLEGISYEVVFTNHAPHPVAAGEPWPSQGRARRQARHGQASQSGEGSSEYKPKRRDIVSIHLDTDTDPFLIPRYYLLCKVFFMLCLQKKVCSQGSQQFPYTSLSYHFHRPLQEISGLVYSSLMSQ